MSSSNESSRIKPLLEAVSAAAGVMPSGVAAIPTWGVVFAWDAREDASGAILEAVASEEGTIEESGSVDNRHGSIIGVLLKPDPDSGMTLEDTAGSLTFRYAMATGKEFLDGPPPF